MMRGLPWFSEYAHAKANARECACPAARKLYYSELELIA